jgi:CubicO group peptidase (beta-lactamase class C family)
VADLRRAIEAIEHGLLRPKGKKDHYGKPLDLAKRMAYYKVPGISFALVDEGALSWARGCGLAEAGTSRQVTPGTIFQAASISKPLTALVALRLAQDGLLDLDVDVNDMLHSWKVPRSKYTQPQLDGTHPRVTMRGLLSHTAGISIFGYLGYPAGSPLPSLQQILRGEPPATTKPVKVMQLPGKEVRYSGGGYVVAQQVIEDVAGKSLVSLAQEFIFDKLGMASSTFNHVLPERYLPQVATGHLRTGEPVSGKWHIYPENAPASLWSTPSDLARLVIELIKSYRNQSSLLLSTGMTRQMLTPQLGIAGLGFFIIQVGGGHRFEHPGWNVGFHSLLIGDLVSGQGLVWMANGENGRKLGWEVTRGLAQVFGWRWS